MTYAIDKFETDAETVHLQVDGNVGILTLDNPRSNLVTRKVTHDLGIAVEAAENSGIRALLVRGNGPNFCAGANVKIFKDVSARRARNAFSRDIPALQRLENLPYPVVCAVQGFCLAAGLEIALACDMIWAAESAQFAQLEATIGTATLLGGVQRLVERVGSARAKEIVFTAEMYSAAQFERWNIINRVVPDDKLAEESLAFVRRLAEGPRSHTT
jgi:enoyl-CoA hydratase/carnithine racemase